MPTEPLQSNSTGGDAESALLSPRVIPSRRKSSRIVCIGLIAIAVVVCIIALALALRPQPDTPEVSFINMVDTTRLRDHLQFLTANSHIAGSHEDYITAMYVRDRMLEHGIPDVKVERMNVLLSYPLSRRVEITYPPSALFTASLEEAQYPEDPTSYKPSVATFLSYSANGDVTAELVYANYGRIEDYLWLQQAGINVTGKIVITRYAAYKPWFSELLELWRDFPWQQGTACRAVWCCWLLDLF